MPGPLCPQHLAVGLVESSCFFRLEDRGDGVGEGRREGSMGSLDQLHPSTMPRRSPGPEELMALARKQFSLPGIQPFLFLDLSQEGAAYISKRNPEAS